MTIDENKGTTETKTETILPVLKADLTWSQLYTKAMHKDLVEISAAVSRKQPTPFNQPGATPRHMRLLVPGRATSRSNVPSLV